MRTDATKNAHSMTFTMKLIVFCRLQSVLSARHSFDFVFFAIILLRLKERGMVGWCGMGERERGDRERE